MFNAPVTFQQAADQLSSRMDRPTAMKYQAIVSTWDANARRHAFFSSRVAESGILGELHRRAQAVVEGKMSRGQARRLLREYFVGEGADALAALGFAPPKDARGVTQLASIPRLELILDTNVRMAQETGHWQKWKRMSKAYPYGIWRVGVCDNHRKSHLERDGKVYAFDHPIWTQSPPGGEFHCHCRRELATAEDLEDMGLKPQPNDSQFEPSSLGFDPSADDFPKPPVGKRVPEPIAEKAEQKMQEDEERLAKKQEVVKPQTVSEQMAQRLQNIEGVEKVDFDGWKDEDGIRNLTEQLERLGNEYDVPPPVSRLVVEPMEGKIGGSMTRVGHDDRIRNQMTLNIKVLDEIPEWRRTLNTATNGRYTSMNCFMLKDHEAECLATHEFGHRIMNQFTDRGQIKEISDYINLVYKKHKKGWESGGAYIDIAREVSKYAEVSWEEFWSESFSIYKCGDKDSLPVDVRAMVGNVLSCIRKVDPQPISRITEVTKLFRKEYKWLENAHASLDLFGTKHLEIFPGRKNNIIIPDNVAEIRDVLDKCAAALLKDGTPPVLPRISLGELLPVHREAVGLELEDPNVYLESPGSRKYGISHWVTHHLETINSEKAFQVLRSTLWNKDAKIVKSQAGGIKRLSIFDYNAINSIANIFVISQEKKIMTLNLIDLWNPPTQYLDKILK